MKKTIKIKGKVLFNPPDKTNKHKKQGKWKKVAVLMISGDICEYYKWFMLKRFNLPLVRPLRRAHVTFISDRSSDMTTNGKDWDKVKKKWNGKSIEIELHLTPSSDDINWWLALTEESRSVLHEIRTELGLGRPYWGLHMTIGYANISYDDSEFGKEKIARDNISHSKYVNGLIKKGLIN